MALFSLAGLLAAASLAQPLTSTHPWNVEAEPDLCLLSREFGSGPGSIVVGFQPIFDMAEMEVIVISNHATNWPQMGTGQIVRLPDGRKFRGAYLSRGLAKSARSYTRITVARSLFDELDRADMLRIKAGSVDTTVRITGFNKARPVFKDCENTLLQSWGVDPANLAGERAPRPLDDVQSIFARKGYPKEARDNGYIGRVTAILNIDPAGQVTNCRVVVGGGKVLSDATCAQARQLRFAPGTDLVGKAVASFYVMRVQWKFG